MPDQGVSLTSDQLPDPSPRSMLKHAHVNSNHSDPVQLDQDQTFPPAMRTKFQSLLHEFDSVFYFKL